jgi:hypothetical protein
MTAVQWLLLAVVVVAFVAALARIEPTEPPAMPLTTDYLRTLGFTGQERSMRIEHRGPSMDGEVVAAVQVYREASGGLTLRAVVTVTNPTEDELRRVAGAVGIDV